MSSSSQEIIIANMVSMENGQFGCKFADATTVLPDLSAAPGEYYYGIVKALSTSVVTFVSRPTICGDATLTSIPMPVGSTIGGKFNLVTVTSGKVMIYMGKEANPDY